MSTVGSILLDQQILLESGTNELEMLVFRVAGYTFGINVAKVREVLPLQQITRLARAHASVRGVFRLRNRVIPCVSLVDHLELQPADPEGERTMILTDFNQQQTAFLVDHVERIHRLSWENILSVPALLAMSQSPVTAVARCSERLVVLLDFEMIIDQVSGHRLRAGMVANPHGLPRDNLRIFLADDSVTVREAIAKTLRASGYTQITTFTNGAEAWQEIELRFQRRGKCEDVADLLISDVEMPQIDGLHLTKRIKDHPELRRLPVLLYSSIVTPDNLKKGAAVGADAQVSKPELHKVVGLADDLIRRARTVEPASPAKPATDIVMPPQEAPQATVASPPAARPVAFSPSPNVEPPKTSAAAPRDEPRPANVAPVAPISQKAIDPAPAGGICARTSSPRKPSPNLSDATGEFARADRELWRTFAQELQGNLPRLCDLSVSCGAPKLEAQICQDLGRMLHSIKSAASVVPLDTVTRATHLVESVLARTSAGAIDWPREVFNRYVDWLADLCSPMSDPRDALAAGRALEGELSELVSGSTQGAA